MNPSEQLEANRQHTLRRFRAPTATLFLRASLPSELVHIVRQFLYNDASKRRGDHRMAMLMLPLAHCQGTMKLCTPCAHCHLRYCYSTFCNTCDAMLWMDMG